MLSDSEWTALQAAHDRYLAAYEDLRTSTIAPFLDDVRDAGGEAAFADPVLLRRRIARHAGIVDQIAALDESFLSDALAALGPGRESTVQALRDRRRLDRANALSQGDGGKSLLDLRTAIDRLGFDEQTMAAIAPDLSAFAASAAQLADRIAHEQSRLPVRYLEVVESKGRPEDLVDPKLDGESRKQAMNRLQQERFAAARRDLESLLGQYSDLVDATLGSIAPRLPPDEAERLERRLLRLRVDDDTGRLADVSAFEALVASRATDVPSDVRDRIAGMREEFLARDAELLKSALAIYREGKVPGVLEPGGPGAAEERKARRAALDKERAQLAKQFHTQVFALIPIEVRDKIGGLANRNRNEFPDALAEIVGAGRVPALVARRPRGFGDGEPPQPAQPPGREGDGGGMRMLLPAAPSEADLLRLAERAGLSGDAREVLREINDQFASRYEQSRDTTRERTEKLTRDMLVALEAGDFDRANREIGRLLSYIDGVRRERATIDDAFAADVEAAIPGLSPAALEMWRWERADLNWRLQWDDVPSEEQIAFAVESTLVLMDVVAAADLPVDATPLVADTLRPILPELQVAGETMRRDTLEVVREILRIYVEARAQKVREDEALKRNEAALRRAMAPVKASSRRVAELHAEALDRLVSALPPPEARRLRERYIAAAYQRVFDESRTAVAAIAGMRNDPDLDADQHAAVERIAEARERAREAAIERLRAWARDPSISTIALRGRDALVRRQPSVAAAAFARDEADARAIRACIATLRPAQRDRHRDLDAWFDDAPVNVRLYD